MRKPLPLVFLATLLITVAAGCGDDAVKPDPKPDDTGIIRGEIGDSDFEFEVDRAGSATEPFEGPFVLRGTKLHYDTELHALVVDLTVINHGEFAQHEPIGLTFLDLIPDAVTVLNPDNDIHGDGAAIVFHFANDDGLWTPGEASLPRTVQFGVDPGVSIGFVARLDIGEAVDGGTIAGRVWNDLDQDGKMDGGEPGLPGVGIYLNTFSGDDSTVTREFWFTETGPDGRYAFDHLRAGAYVVSEAPATFDCRPTTPTEIRVLLTEIDGDVADFLDANFGCASQAPPPPIAIGERVDIEGKFYEPDYFVVFTIFHVPCPDDTVRVPLPPDVDPDCFGGRLRGPVTAIAPDHVAFKVMNTWVIPDAAMIIPFPLQVGTRVDVHVHRAGNFATWVVDSIDKWEGPFEQIHGRIEAVEVDPSGHFRVFVLDTWISVPDITVGQR